MLMASLLCGDLPNLSMVSPHPHSILTIKGFIYLYTYLYAGHSLKDT